MWGGQVERGCHDGHTEFGAEREGDTDCGVGVERRIRRETGEDFLEVFLEVEKKSLEEEESQAGELTNLWSASTQQGQGQSFCLPDLILQKGLDTGGGCLKEQNGD